VTVVCSRSLAGTAGSNPDEAWMFVLCEGCVLSGIGPCDGPNPRPEESYRLRCVAECNHVERRPSAATAGRRNWGGIGTEKNIHANKAEVANIKWPRNIKSATSKKKSGFKMYINYQTRVRL